MDKSKEIDEGAKTWHNQNNNIRPDDIREAGDVGTDEAGSQTSDSAEKALGGTGAEQFKHNGADSKAESNIAGNQTMGIP